MVTHIMLVVTHIMLVVNTHNVSGLVTDNIMLLGGGSRDHTMGLP